MKNKKKSKLKSFMQEVEEASNNFGNMVGYGLNKFSSFANNVGSDYHKWKQEQEELNWYFQKELDSLTQQQKDDFLNWFNSKPVAIQTQIKMDIKEHYKKQEVKNEVEIKKAVKEEK